MACTFGPIHSKTLGSLQPLKLVVTCACHVKAFCGVPQLSYATAKLASEQLQQHT